MSGESGYFLPTYEDRDRLYKQFTLLQPNVMAGFAQALVLGGLDPHPATATWALLDVGCGEGLYAHHLSERYPNCAIRGIDRDEEAIATANVTFAGPATPNLTFSVHDILTPVPDTHIPLGGYPLAMAVLVLCHTASAPTALRTIAQALQPGGILYSIDLISPYHDIFPASPALMEIARLTDMALVARCSPIYGTDPEPLLAEAGFTLCTRERLSYPLGGDSAAGQAALHNILQVYRASRRGVIGCGLITAERWDALYAQALAEIQPEMRGRWSLSKIIARRQ